MTWVVFANRGAFESWHAIKWAGQGIPHPGYNQATNEPDILGQWTDAYSDPWTADNTITVYTNVPPDVVTADGLTEAEVTTDPETREMTVTVDGVQQPMHPPTDNSHRAPKPPTWRDPETNIVYNTATGEPMGGGGAAKPAPEPKPTPEKRASGKKR
jgi:hypothetical protein